MCSDIVRAAGLRQKEKLRNPSGKVIYTAVQCDELYKGFEKANEPAKAYHDKESAQRLMQPQSYWNIIRRKLITPSHLQGVHPHHAQLHRPSSQASLLSSQQVPSKLQ